MSRTRSASFASAVVLVVACGGGTTSGSSPSSSDDGGSSESGVGPEVGADAGDASSGDGGAQDAPADVDNGAPSTNYPAPHPPLPVLTNLAGGPVLATPKVVLVFYPNDTREAALTDFAKKVGGSTYWNAVTHEYGIGPLTYVSTVELTGMTAPTTISSADVGTFMASEIQSGALGTPDPQTIYTIVYPTSTTVTQPNPVSPALGTVNSCQAFTGYHDNVSVALTDGGAPTGFAYAVIPTCPGGVDQLTSVMSHEWVESSTDPLVTSNGAFTLTPSPTSAFFSVDTDHTVWAILGGGEAGDLCEPEMGDALFTPADIGHLVQRTWSNASAQASHDPCVPAVTAPFFDSAPVLTEDVSFTSPVTGTVKSKGITIPVGQSKTIEVDLFSDADTGGPWTVAAYDVLAKYYGSYGLQPTMTFAWDRTKGVNGEKLHLTITVTTASIIGGAHAFMIASTLNGRQRVWPGLVVE